MRNSDHVRSEEVRASVKNNVGNYADLLSVVKKHQAVVRTYYHGKNTFECDIARNSSSGPTERETAKEMV